MATEITDTALQQMLSEGLSQNEIARRTNIPRSTLRRRLKILSTPSVYSSVQDTSTLQVYQSTQLSEKTPATDDELQEILAWWRERKRALQITEDKQDAERKTYIVQKRYIEAIHRAAELEHVSITEMVNHIFAQYFSREHH